MGKIKKEDIIEILSKYDKKNITIATLGSHTALHILNGAKQEGFRTAVVCEPGKEKPYERFGVADEFIFVDKYSDIVKEDIQKQLRDMNAIVVPHGSFVAYAGLDNVEDKFNVPMFGNRDVLRWEAERDKERKMITEAGIRMPYKYDDPEKIDKEVMVKFPGARGGQGYFICSNYEEFQEKIEEMKARDWINDDDVKNAHIEEYVCGTNFCIHYFYSVLNDEVEVLGMDSRYETNIDGIVRIPAQDQIAANLSPSYVVSGNHPVVIRESLLPQVFDNGDKLVEKAKELVKPGMNGPFCLQCLCNDDRELVIFEMSARIDGGTNTFMNGSAYSYLKFGEPMSMGRRICREIKNAVNDDKLEDIIT